ncbi:hypothetical protein Fmac_010357 [Flemingia macrophylla]|uniref:Uncharacterized protein n=1 Tax=Flemingia macrophylla TaxID=520843 RepID=A0ABD1MJM3_9FABA
MRKPSCEGGSLRGGSCGVLELLHHEDGQRQWEQRLEPVLVEREGNAEDAAARKFDHLRGPKQQVQGSSTRWGRQNCRFRRPRRRRAAQLLARVHLPVEGLGRQSQWPHPLLCQGTTALAQLSVWIPVSLP